MFNPQPKPTKQPKKFKHIKQIGAKGKEWEDTKKILKPSFEAAGITSCEVRWQGCDNFFLTWAHGDKRTRLTGNELLTLVVLACVHCHNIIEHKISRLEMRALVERIISERRVQPNL